MNATKTLDVIAAPDGHAWNCSVRFNAKPGNQAVCDCNEWICTSHDRVTVIRVRAMHIREAERVAMRALPAGASLFSIRLNA